MVEGFLNTSLAERKEFFDEATGVKQYQIKRDDSLNKLRSSHENLGQAQMLLDEIEPRLKSLTRQVGRLQKRGELEEELKGLQIAYYSKTWHDIDKSFGDFNSRYLELEKEKLVKDKKMEALNRELAQLEKDGGNNDEYNQVQVELSRAQQEKDEINKKLARVEAQLEMKLEASGQFDLSFLINKKEEINKDIAGITIEIEKLLEEIKSEKVIGEELEKEKDKINKDLDKLNSDLTSIDFNKKVEGAEEIGKRLQRILGRLQTIKQASDLDEIRKIIDDIENDIKEAIAGEDKEAVQKNNESANAEWQRIQGEIRKLSHDKEALIGKINENKLRISGRFERARLLEEKNKSNKTEIENIIIKLSQKEQTVDIADFESRREELKKEISGVEEKISCIKVKFDEINAREGKKRDKLFSLQKDLQSMQAEINIVVNQLNDLKVSSTRYETKLEDLEAEIRQELGGLGEVKQNKNYGDINVEETKHKINQIKKQLELIGGIDPQVEKEYAETKERFDFLSGQVNDLLAAIESLEKVIKELDIVIKERFDKEFKVIALNFEKYFKVLFNGGSAKIVKVMDTVEDSKEAKNEADGESVAAEKKEGVSMDIKKIKYLQKHNATGLAGIEIKATPPGKKINSISMLSGGERALTAIALICAIISANPSPFVVLDEVDAALDEANSERLAKILDELSHKTQFITITHNRALMRRANILYGVTMGDDGVSKLLSIKLDEAAAVEKM
jgi:chromosome segregation protein